MPFGQRKNPVDPVKTHDEVVQDLLTQLCQSANKSLGSNAIELDDPPTIENLRIIYALLATQRFKENFGYAYAGPDTAPPSLAGGTVSVAQAFLDVGDGQTASKLIDNIVNNQISSELTDVPQWAKVSALSDLTAKFTQLASPSTSGTLGNDWSSQKFSPTYQPGQKYDNCIHSDSMFIFVNGSLKEDDIKVTRNVVLYIGVFYEVKSAARVAKEALWLSICETANTLIPKPVPLSNPPTMEELLKILDIYRDQAFLKDFSFSYSGENNLPEDALADWNRVTKLFVYEDGNISSVENDASDYVKKLGLPEWVSTNAGPDILQELRYLVTSAPNDGNAWEPVTFTRSYFPASPSDPTMSTKAEILYCNAISSAIPSVTLKCVFYSDVFYTMPSVKDIVTQDLIKVLCKSGQDLLSQPINVPDKPTQENLTDVIVAAGTSQFKKDYGFDYKGKETQPPDVSPNSPVYGFQAITYPDGSDSDAAAQFVDNEILSRSAVSFSKDEGLFNKVRQELIGEVQTALQADSGEIVRSLPKDKTFDYSDLNHDPLAMKLVMIFTKASMSETLQNNYTAHVTSVSLTGVLYDQASNPW